MSTNSRIIVAIPERAWGKTYQHPRGEAEEFETPAVTIPQGAKLVSIYCHWDGYLDGVGKELSEKYNTFEKAMELIAGGDASVLGTQHYHGWRNEDWEEVKPFFSFEDELKGHRPEEFNYYLSLDEYPSLLGKSLWFWSEDDFSGWQAVSFDDNGKSVPEARQTEFPILNLTRADLIERGFDGDSLDDEQMEGIAHKMTGVCCEAIMEAYWLTLVEVCEHLGIKRLEEENS